MHVVSVNVGMPREVDWNGSTVSTAIFKEPVEGKVAVRTLNLDGDAQTDLTVHGGAEKAVYAYPFEHYEYWQAQLGRSLPLAAFGENLTTEGLLEGSVHIGDEFIVGTARLIVTQFRMPCFKLGIRFGDPGMVKAFLQSGRLGIYFAALEEGAVSQGDAIELVHTDKRLITLSDMLRVSRDRHAQADDLRQLIAIPALAEGWRQEFQSRLDKALQ